MLVRGSGESGVGIREEQIIDWKMTTFTSRK